MRAPLLRAGLTLALASLCGLAQAIEYRSVAEPAILYDTPSDKGNKLYIIGAGTPVEVVVSLDKWVKVRDPGGALTWIERKSLADKRTLIVTAARAAVRQQPATDAAVVFEAAKDVILESTGTPADGWIKVKHADGASGFVRVTEVWGL